MSLLDKLRRENPKENVLVTAVDKLNTVADIRQFYFEYVEALRVNQYSDILRKYPEAAANNNIAHLLLGHDENKDKWFEAIPAIKHYMAFGVLQ
ncbi:MAG: hypothetical protein PHO02_00070 [Candidatus Nanoarchaeia archaeon]|nr:hypothetical protein [Candidatus Nanoarchaeia archaeon]